jgi:hypothetical protein
MHTRAFRKKRVLVEKEENGILTTWKEGIKAKE